MRTVLFITVIGLFLGMGCGTSSDGYKDEKVSFTSFDDGTLENWVVGFSQYPVGLEDSFKLSYRFGDFSMGTNYSKSLIIRGKNWNMDLFMYMKGKVGALEPDTYYEVIIDVELYVIQLEDYLGDLSNEYSGSFLKVGAFTNEPQQDTIIDSELPDLELISLNIDIGDEHEDGFNISNLGKLTFSLPDEAPIVFRGFNSDNLIKVKTNSHGEVWLIVGVDSNVAVYQDAYFNFVGARYGKVGSQ